MATHSIRLRLRPQALQAALLVSARQESRRALRVLLDFFMICVWVGAVMAEIFMPYWIIHGNTYKYGTWPYIWDGLYIGRSMAWITASTLS